MKRFSILSTSAALLLLSGIGGCGGSGTPSPALARGSLFVVDHGFKQVSFKTGEVIRRYPFEADEASVSPDRRKILYSLNGTLRTYFLESGGTGPVSVPGRLTDGQFLRNGRISFWSATGDSPPRHALISSNPDGSESVEHYATEYPYQIGGSLSPDGSRLIVARQGSYWSQIDFVKSTIELRDASGILLRNLHDESAGPVVSEVSWSPDSKNIGYRDSYGVIVQDVNTGEKRRVVDFRSTNYPQISNEVNSGYNTYYEKSRSAWSRDSKLFAFSALYLENRHIFIVNVATGSIQSLFPFKVTGTDMLWTD